MHRSTVPKQPCACTLDRAYESFVVLRTCVNTEAWGIYVQVLLHQKFAASYTFWSFCRAQWFVKQLRHKKPHTGKIIRHDNLLHAEKNSAGKAKSHLDGDGNLKSGNPEIDGIDNISGVVFAEELQNLAQGHEGEILVPEVESKYISGPVETNTPSEKEGSIPESKQGNQKKTNFKQSKKKEKAKNTDANEEKPNIVLGSEQHYVPCGQNMLDSWQPGAKFDHGQPEAVRLVRSGKSVETEC